MKSIFFIVLIFFSLNLLGQVSKKELRYKPKNFEEAITQLDKHISDSIKNQIKLMTEEEYIGNTHFTTGMSIRNNWLYNRYLFGLIVTKSELRKDLVSKGLFNNDDMSSAILCSYHRKLNNKEIDFEQQIKDIHQRYINMNNPKWRAQQDSIYWANYMNIFQIGDTLTRRIYYDRNWLGNPRKNTIIEAQIIDKSKRQLKINIISFGTEENEEVVYNEIRCVSGDCWINPSMWRNKVN